MATYHRVLRYETGSEHQFVDLTDEVAECVAASGVQNGMVNVQTTHTTAAIIVNEHEPLLLDDMRSTLERAAPRAIPYRHDDFSVRTVNLSPGEPANGHAHCQALFLRTAETLNVLEGRIQLGRWQRIFLIELDHARDRSVSVMVVGD